MRYLKVILFKALVEGLGLLLRKPIMRILWLMLWIIIFWTTISNTILISPKIDLAIFFFSFVFFWISVVEACIYKKLTEYVIVNRITKSIHMNSSAITNSVLARQNLALIVQTFVQQGLGKLSKKRTYTFKTHQVIINALENSNISSHVRNVQIVQTGSGIIYEKSILVSFKIIVKDIFALDASKRGRFIRKFIFKLENKYKVTIDT